MFRTVFPSIIRSPRTGKIVRLVGFIIEIYYDARSHERQKSTPLLYHVITEVQGVQLKSGPYFNMSNLFTKIYNMLYDDTTNLYLQ